jgi:hypothetical protein
LPSVIVALKLAPGSKELDGNVEAQVVEQHGPFTTLVLIE